jgi:hypothetical protein
MKSIKLKNLWATAIAVALSLNSIIIQAGIKTWDGGGANVNWSTTANWNPDGLPLIGDNLIFSGTTRQVNTNNFGRGTNYGFIQLVTSNWFLYQGTTYINLTNGFTNSSIGGNNTNFLIIRLATANQTWRNESSNTMAFAGNITNNGLNLTLINNSPIGTMLFSGIISGSGGITNPGPGVVSFITANTYTGKTVIKGGAHSITNENQLGGNPASFVADQLTLDGGTLLAPINVTIDDANRGITIGDGGAILSPGSGRTLTLSRPIVGASIITNAGAGIVTLTTTNSSYTGKFYGKQGVLRITDGYVLGPVEPSLVPDKITLDGGALWGNTSEPTLDANFGITLGTAGGTLANGWGRNFNINSPITGVGNLTIGSDVTPGNIILNGVNNYSGATTVGNSGSATSWALLQVNGSLESTPSVLLRTNGLLGGTGTIKAPVTTTTNGIISPGAIFSAGTLNIQGNVALTNAVLNFDLANVTTEGSGVNDLLAITGDFTAQGTNTIVINPLNGALANATYRLINYSGNPDIAGATFVCDNPRYNVTMIPPRPIRLT